MKLLYQFYKWLIFAPLFFISTVVLGLLLALTIRFNPVFVSRWVPRLWARFNYRITPAGLSVEGEQHINKNQSYIIVANHLSQFDIFVLYGWMMLDLKWVMKKELRNVFVIGPVCALMGHVFLDRSNRQASMRMLQDLKEQLRPGMSVLFFPEGTRSRDSVLKRFKKGAFVTAKDLGLPVLPVTIIGTEKILPPGSLDLYPGTARMIIHPPISSEEVSELSEEALMIQARESIASALPEGYV